jgi:hypothetical protein
MFHLSWGLMFIHHNISAACTLLDFPTRDRFVRELEAGHYDIVGISSIVVNVGKVRERSKRCRQGRNGSFAANGIEPLGVDHDEPLLLGADDILFSPAAHDADRGFDRRAGHVRQLLA